MKLSQTSVLLNHDPLPIRGDLRNPSQAACIIADRSTFERVAVPWLPVRRLSSAQGDATTKIGVQMMNRYLRQSRGKVFAVTRRAARRRHAAPKLRNFRSRCKTPSPTVAPTVAHK